MYNVGSRCGIGSGMACPGYGAGRVWQWQGTEHGKSCAGMRVAWYGIVETYCMGRDKSGVSKACCWVLRGLSRPADSGYP